MIRTVITCFVSCCYSQNINISPSAIYIIKPKSIDECVKMCATHERYQKSKHKNTEIMMRIIADLSCSYSLTHRLSVTRNDSVHNLSKRSVKRAILLIPRIHTIFFLTCLFVRPFSSTFKYYSLTYNFEDNLVDLLFS